MRIFSEANSNGSTPPSAETSGIRERIRANLAGVGATIAFASARGGVGKSMLAVNIAAALAIKGRKVVIVCDAGDAAIGRPGAGTAPAGDHGA